MENIIFRNIDDPATLTHTIFAFHQDKEGKLNPVGKLAFVRETLYLFEPVSEQEPEQKKQREFYIEEINTYPKYRRQGVATALLQEFFRCVEQIKSPVKVELEVCPTAETEEEFFATQEWLLEFYKKFGFEINPEPTMCNNVPFMYKILNNA